MVRVVLSLLFVFLISCAFNNRSRKNVAHSDVVFKGGVYKDLSWDENLRFSRISWYNEATMQYDVLINELKPDSKFVNWLGRDKGYLDECKKFYVAVLYSDITIGEGVNYLANQIQKTGLEPKTILDFADNLKAHYNFADWRLYEYKVYGFCKKLEHSDIIVSIPGYKTQIL